MNKRNATISLFNIWYDGAAEAAVNSMSSMFGSDG